MHRIGPALLLPLAGAVLLSAGGQSALAQRAERAVVDPPVAKARRSAPEISITAQPEAAGPRAGAAVGHEAVFAFNIQYTEAKIYNPGTNQDDPVKLRSYRDVHETEPPKIPFVAPTIEIFPGETVRITLNNDKLPADPKCPPGNSDVNDPNCFNRTNLHAHGLWVSPTGNSDNVLLSINQGVSFQYEYNIPPDHPAGTYWYHPHRHGSTALQVSSGMAGVLIVRGSRLPGADMPGDVDTLLRYVDGRSFRERPVLLQQIQYACRDGAGKIKQDNTGLYICDPATDVGGIEGYDQFGPTTWRNSGRYTSINGEVVPTFEGAKAGEIERWRVVHAGVRDTVNLQFRKMKDGAEPYASVATQQQEDWLTRNCPGPALLPQFALAADGLTRAQLVERTSSTLQPGYREDMLIVFPEAGNYCVLDGAAPAASTVNSQAKSRQYLGRVAVAPGTAVPDIRAHIQAQLLAAADRFMPPSVKQRVKDDLSNGLRLRAFVAHPDIADGEIKPPQREARFEIGAGGFMINGNPYKPDRIDQLLPLGGVEEWKLSTANAFGHPFHIHVNPFQISRIINPAGQDVSETGDANEPQYANLKGVWKDTLFIRQGYTAFVRTRYQRYIGDFVLHCHILDHEDQGMMQNVRIGIPDGAGSVAASHH
ncbi:multicopper oxidase domain-containing protein [Bradyrhizobium tropiciagri]|uniref:multicopper oxidase family protein n=1 Tax=Bradyrhizobium tropiciagri TaxID=312253 RepID=UPI001BACBD90|nr:multicopper oxidase family protein [Bradyrhizobium tropiciagri]MBR0872251.1 multicopper oxidase domain-containing protein [Bradyrhizobium tropiciagri]